MLRRRGKEGYNSCTLDQLHGLCGTVSGDGGHPASSRLTSSLLHSTPWPGVEVGWLIYLLLRALTNTMDPYPKHPPDPLWHFP